MKSQIGGSVIAGVAALGISASALAVHQYNHKLPTEIRVVDGDTLEVDGTPIRLAGINTPEPQNACKNGKQRKADGGATEELVSFISGGGVACQELEPGIKRKVGRCWAGGKEANMWMVRNGWACASRRFSESKYRDAERLARAEKVGLWAAPGGARNWQCEDDKPNKQTAMADVRPPSCPNPIKGNISRGRCIYHLPSQHFYKRAKIDPTKGERWFCSEQEAIAAGWRTYGQRHAMR